MIDDRAAYRVTIFDERRPSDLDRVSALRRDSRVTTVDLRPRQYAQLKRLLPAPGDDLLNEAPRLIYYPWRHMLTSMIGPKSLRVLRLDRNRNKITNVEQEKFAENIVGIVGLSVGHAIARTLALEGLVGELRLADTETLESSDLNRVPAPTIDLGLNKAVATARHVAEIDPYLPIRVYSTEFDQKLCDEFMTDLDIVIEESFSLQTKIMVREAARAMRKPVIMATSNRGMLDIERFDIDPSRPLFHGLLTSDEIAEIRSLPDSRHDKYHYRLLETDMFSTRLIATRFELGRTLSGWPQLGSELQLAGATVSTAVRRIILGPALSSGRVRLDLDDHLDLINDPERPQPARPADSTTRRNLDVLVTRIATKLMGVDPTAAIPVTLSVLSELRDFFGVDHVSLYRHDRERRVAILIAEWPMRDVIPDPDPAAEIDYALADCADSGEYSIEAHIVQGDGDTRAVVPMVEGDASVGFLTLTTTGHRIWDADALDSVTAIATLLATLKKRLEVDDRLRHLATHDDLTNLSNRRALIEHMEQRLQPGMPGPMATISIDLDRLKALNDFIGHPAGDEFIRTVARRLREHAEPNDLIARTGGDEFVVVPAGRLDVQSATATAKRIQTLIGERVEIGGERVSRSASIGVAVSIPGEVSVSDVLRHADQAMLAAKASGGSSIALFTDEMRSERALRDDIELHLRHAAESDALVLHYQPEVDLQTGRILAVEALVRWNHPTRGLLYPGTFIEIAEATNLAGEIGRWVINHACSQLAEWRSRGLAEDIVMRMNVSPVQLVSLDFVTSVKEVLDLYQIDGQSVCFEITEHVVVQDIQRTRVTLAGLKQIGAAVAIDDFGTGHSSLTHLKELDVNALKIDRGFVTRLGSDAHDLAIVKSVVGLAGLLDLEIVAEGVETSLAAQTLIQLGCERAQGYLISRPIPPEELEPMLSVGAISFASTVTSN